MLLSERSFAMLPGNSEPIQRRFRTLWLQPRDGDNYIFEEEVAPVTLKPLMQESSHEV